MAKKFTIAELADRWYDKRDVQNLAGKYVTSLLLKREGTIFDTFWSKRGDVCLGFDDGYYVGREAVGGYYAAAAEHTAKKSRFIKELFPDKLIALFGAANESSYYTDYAIRAFRVYLCMIILATVNKATFIYLQSLGKALLSTMLSMVRELVFGVGLAILLPQFFGLDGVLYSMPVADVLTFIISVSCILYTMRLLSKPITRAAT